MNHHDQYKRWCLALWIARDLPGTTRKLEPELRKLSDRDLRRRFIDKYEERHGKDPELKTLIARLWESLRRNEEPVYEGPFQPAQIGKPHAE